MNRVFFPVRLISIFLVVLSFSITTYAQVEEEEGEVITVPPADTTDNPPVTVTTVDEEQQEEERYFLFKDDAAAPVHPVRDVPADHIDDLKQSPDFWYADEAQPGKKKKARSRGWLSGEGVQNVILIITILAFVVLLGLFLANSNINFIRRSKKILSNVDDPGVITEDIFQIDYDREIRQAVGNNQFRPAVRLMYLRLLKQLADRGLISYHKDQTNADYLQQLSRGPYYKDFFRLTREYEYSWYGLFEIDRDTFGVIQRDFDSFTAKMTAR